MPQIDLIQNKGADADRYPWRCDISERPGYHGVGRTQAQALLMAASAWAAGEDRQRFEHNTKEDQG
ncbi:hypothetical protein [Shimia ponticola]|uniref:hypothetical protein n=1 Tax=Shimia ponticola TaxID=2582893 RepID=UPI0011BD8426|nr:hypothetical protein [Shimia ponticola]